MKKTNYRSKKSRDRGQKTLNRGSDKPRKFLEKSLQKVQVTVSDLFLVEAYFFSCKVHHGGPGHRFWAEKCDLHFRYSRQYISEKVVVLAAANVCHLRNRARNTRKLKILMFEGFRGEKHYKNRKNRKWKRNPRV